MCTTDSTSMASGRLRVVVEYDKKVYNSDMVVQRLVKVHGFDVVSFNDVYAEPSLGEGVVGAVVTYRGTGIHPICRARDLHLFPDLKIVGNLGIGYDHLDVKALAEKGIVAANTPLVVGDGPADLAFALMLASARNFKQGFRIMDKDFDPLKDEHVTLQLGVNVCNATLGIIGLGNIGFRLAKRARGFEMKAFYHDVIKKTPEEEAALGVTFVPDLHEMLSQADFVIVSCPCSPRTEKLMGAKEFDAMKPSATLINVARGKIVDTDALVDAIRNNKIRAAALDVTDPEPLPRDHPLLSFPNVIVMPHRGGATTKTVHDMIDVIGESIKKTSQGVPISNRLVP